MCVSVCVFANLLLFMKLHVRERARDSTEIPAHKAAAKCIYARIESRREYSLSLLTIHSLAFYYFFNIVPISVSNKIPFHQIKYKQTTYRFSLFLCKSRTLLYCLNIHSMVATIVCQNIFDQITDNNQNKSPSLNSFFSFSTTTVFDHFLHRSTIVSNDLCAIHD